MNNTTPLSEKFASAAITEKQLKQVKGGRSIDSLVALKEACPPPNAGVWKSVSMG